MYAFKEHIRLTYGFWLCEPAFEVVDIGVRRVVLPIFTMNIEEPLLLVLNDIQQPLNDLKSSQSGRATKNSPSFLITVLWLKKGDEFLHRDIMAPSGYSSEDQNEPD